MLGEVLPEELEGRLEEGWVDSPRLTVSGSSILNVFLYDCVRKTIFAHPCAGL